jgi:hypothetical protein
MPHEEGTVPSTLVAVSEVSVGTTELGTERVAVQVVLPIRVFPLYVLQVIVTLPLVLFGIWFASVREGVQLTEVLLVFVAIVPVALPKVYVSVWVKLLDARLMLIVPVLPRFVADMLQEDFLGIVYRATVA